ncbi:MAG TPA: glycosyltransferase family 4 protein [bacterium]|nr:glycosyltransferase family 4 protein [Candidatus Omnitrophota bacterium]HOJ59150.1 glycosyltransferase family 4 protein [bacterium]HOL95488.1 glycosyltransferase family 4 protein [bacterium]HPP00054.1 glycosyltransferase family 4 protein [bacterium]
MPDSPNRPHAAMKKKVVRVIARLNIGGPAIHVILLTAHLDPERYESILLYGQEAPEEGNMLHLAEEKGVCPILVSNLGRELHFFRDLKTLWTLYQFFRREQPDIVHTHTAKAGTVGRLAALLAGVPVIVHTFHGHVLHGYFSPWKTAMFRTIERILSRATTRIIAVSEQCRQDLLKYGIAKPEAICTIPLGLDLEPLAHPAPDAGLGLREELGIPPEAFMVGMVARLVPIKRHEDLFHAIPLVLRDYPDTWFVIVGDGERRNELENLAARLGINHRCRFAGFRRDQGRVYRDLDLVVLTSANEGLPVVLIEALASGTPAVATRVGGVPELIEEGKTGYIVEPGNIESIAAGIKKAAADPAQTRAMGQAAREEILRKYSIQRLVGDIEKLYGELLGEGMGKEE